MRTIIEERTTVHIETTERETAAAAAAITTAVVLALRQERVECLPPPQSERLFISQPQYQRLLAR